MTTQCEGWRRRGGMMTFGPVKWSQCSNDALNTKAIKVLDARPIVDA